MSTDITRPTGQRFSSKINPQISCIFHWHGRLSYVTESALRHGKIHSFNNETFKIDLIIPFGYNVHCLQ